MAVMVAPMTSSPSDKILPLIPDVVICAMADAAHSVTMASRRCNLFSITLKFDLRIDNVFLFFCKYN